MTKGTVKYLITLNIEQVGELRKAMESTDIPFDLTEDIIGMPNDNIMEGIYMGRDAEYLTGKINEYLEEQGKPERITQPFNEMDIQAQRDLLLLGSLHSDWEKEFIQKIYLQEWKEFQERHPETISNSQPRTARQPYIQQGQGEREPATELVTESITELAIRRDSTITDRQDLLERIETIHESINAALVADFQQYLELDPINDTHVREDVRRLFEAYSSDEATRNAIDSGHYGALGNAIPFGQYRRVPLEHRQAIPDYIKSLNLQAKYQHSLHLLQRMTNWLSNNRMNEIGERN